MDVIQLWKFFLLSLSTHLFQLVDNMFSNLNRYTQRFQIEKNIYKI